ncbi:cell wall protein DAN4-like [Seriola lalandi dorsalis]|uniref:cell wall protein DAN4-like n=1 Tax=Seriola lalandi dorsalis TaxID=1841481 RepID=UPI000C6FA32A|nr:cell wall protein DAN4-like [Seriola lalandi dorsalis]
MPLIGSSVFILGLVVASAIANEESTSRWPSTVSTEFNTHTFSTDDSNRNNVPSISTTNPNTDSSISRSTSDMYINGTSSTIMPSTTKQRGGGRASQRPTTLSTTPKPIVPKRTSATTTKASKTTANPKAQNTNDNVGIIILVVIIIVSVGFGLACFLARKRARRYSVEFTSRPDEANIPLSTVEPVDPADAVAQNGLQTFESLETTTKESQESAAPPEVQEEQKTEADKSVVDPTAAESAAPAPSPDVSGSEDKPKEDVVEQSPPAPVQPSMEEKTDDEGAVSNKTSVESLKETNDNNSNNANFIQITALESSKIFWDIALDSPV